MKQLLENKKIYLAPYNNLSIEIYEYLQSLDIEICGYIDEFKESQGVYKATDIKEYDFVIVSSYNFWEDISQKFNLKKVLLSHTKLNDLILYEEYKSWINSNLEKMGNFDILFLAYNKSNVIDSSLVIRELNKLGYKSALIDTSNEHRKNVIEGYTCNKDIELVPYDLVKYHEIKSIVCLIDWSDRFLINSCKNKGIKTIGLVDGIEDFEDSDYDFDRKAYETVEYVLTVGRNDMKYLEYKKDKCKIVGLAKMYDMWNSKICFPEKLKVMINLNFTYGTFEEERNMWLEQVLNACRYLNLDYIIAQHHADKGDLEGLNKSDDDIYETIKKSSLVISRFSTVVSESLALGKPVVYHNPHGEKVKLYKNPKGAFSISTDESSLIKMIKYELSNCKDIRGRAVEFLDDQFNIKEEIKPAILAAKNIDRIIKGTFE